MDVNEIAFEVVGSNNGQLLAVPVNKSNYEKADLFSEILRKFSCHVIMNILIREENICLIPDMVSLVERYDCEKYVYFSSGSDKVLRFLAEYAPQIGTCYCVYELDAGAISTACALGCKKLQFCECAYSEEGVVLAHSKGLRCNILFCGDTVQAKAYIDVGIDTLITENDTSVFQLLKTKDI